jgi:hypothetical protein
MTELRAVSTAAARQGARSPLPVPSGGSFAQALATQTLRQMTLKRMENTLLDMMRRGQDHRLADALDMARILAMDPSHPERGMPSASEVLSAYLG